MNITKLLLAGLLVLASTLTMEDGTSAGSGNPSQDVLNSVSTSGQTCSIDPDCKDPQAPYCNITYSLHGNFGTCSAVDEPAPLQVLGDQECPEGTVRQLIYQNEGDEAVCLKP